MVVVVLQTIELIALMFSVFQINAEFFQREATSVDFFLIASDFKILS